MAYLLNIPQPNDQLRNSQGDLLGNFQALNTYLAINHENFASGDAGKHKFVQLTNQAIAPIFGATETGFYNALNLDSGKNQTYIHTQTQSGTSDIPMTASFLGNFAPLNDADGWTYLPSGILVKWMYVTLGAPGGLGVINIPVGANMGPAYSKIFAVSLTIRDGINPNTDVNKAVRLVDITGANQFRVYFSNRTSTGPSTGTAKAIIIGV